jgi:Fungal trichothecene efflux pump (TRI12)
MLSGINLILIFVFYHPPQRPNSLGLAKREVLRRIDFVGGFLSLAGIAMFLTGVQLAGSV